MKVAVIQIGAASNKLKNIEKALAFVRRAIKKEAKFILLPEAFNFRGKANPRKGFRDIAEGFPGPSTRPFMEEARKHKVAILAGSICECASGSKKVFNSSVLINVRGEIAAKYRKMHLFDALIGKTKIKESQHFCAGRKIAVSAIGSWSVGVTICYDLRFPELYRKHAKAGVEILCIPSAFTKITGLAHWEVLLRARAIENLCYVLAPNQIGRNGNGILSYGNSMIIDPWGKILTRASGDKEEIIYARFNKNVLKERRAMLPNRR